MDRTTDNRHQNKNSFIMHLDYIQAINALSDEDAGKLIKGIYYYVSGNGMPELPAMLNVLFLMIHPKLKADLDKWRATCLKNKDNITKRWGNKDTTGTSGIQVSNTNTIDTEGEGEGEGDYEVEAVKKKLTKLTSDLIFSKNDEILLKQWRSTEPGTKIIEQCIKLFKYKLKTEEVDEDISHYEQIMGWVMECIKKKPGNNFLLKQHIDLTYPEIRETIEKSAKPTKEQMAQYFADSKDPKKLKDGDK